MKRNTSIAALSSGERPMKSFGTDRTCSVCETKLSRYNSSDQCGIHRGWGEGEKRRTLQD
ncbi:MAG: hypothetical protein LC722_04035 [Actinobacteria bacterium]|nr:hypothetical protein [Actinomycetota bacterium]